MKVNNKVLLGMSGGTDSSVAAFLLQDAGYEVTGVTFRFYEKDAETAYLDDAADLCRRLQIPHRVYDARELFRREIMTYFVDEYMKGHTPVPCTVCNNRLKWPLLRQLADEAGIYHIATGHYVRKVRAGGHWYMAAGVDSDKDQSFFLWGLPEAILSRMLLPLGEMTKARVREIAAERGFPHIATKRDSLGVCFCPGDYRSFLRGQVGEGSIVPGDFYDEAGNLLGRHEGYPCYTIGQRRGLGIYLNKALFVKQIIPETNRIILSDNVQALECVRMVLQDWRLTCLAEVVGSPEALIVKIRYRKQANLCSVSLMDDHCLCVHLHEPLSSIAIGQAAVFYRGERVLGGGIIREVVPMHS